MNAPSPFLPNTTVQFAWDSTSLGHLKTCPRLYQYIMIDGWGSDEESVHLRFGREYHKALEEFDRYVAAGDNREDSISAAVGDLLKRTTDWNPDPETRAGRYKNRHTLLRAVIDYLDHYDNDAAETYIQADGTPAVELSFNFELDWGPLQSVGSKHQPYLLSGHLDRVVTFSDDLFVMDRKTATTTLSDHYFAGFAPNNQMTLYTLAAGIILNSPIRGVIIDGAQILVDGTRFVRGLTYRTPDQLEEWLANLQVLLPQAENYAATGYWPMNDTACDKFGGCRFREVCSRSPKVREHYLKSKFIKLAEEDRWNPLKPR